MKYKTILLFLFLASSITLANDSSDSSKSEFRLDFSGALYYQSIGSPKTLTPHYLSHKHREQATNNPLFHGASEIEMHAIGEPAKDLTIHASLTADHNGYSFGVYNQHDVAIYPKFFVNYHKAIRRDSLKSSFRNNCDIKFQTGTFQDFRYYEGLQLYNIDFQGFYSHFQYKCLRLSHLHIGDLYCGIGLNINDLMDYMISLENVSFKNFYVDARLGITQYSPSPSGAFGTHLSTLNFSVGIYKTSSQRYYGQLGYRFANYKFALGLKYAALLGAMYKYHSDKLQVVTRAEFRYYGGAYNYGLKNEDVCYRVSSDSNNNVHSPLYPLSLFNRPFSQWAVFTEYHKRYISGFILHSITRFYIGKKIFIFTELDLNTIMTEDEPTFTYPLFKIGFALEPARNTYIMLAITDKAMNLDEHYPTFYCLQEPFLHVELRRDIDWD